MKISVQNTKEAVIGKVFGVWKILEYSGRLSIGLVYHKDRGKYYEEFRDFYKCQCSCGNTLHVMYQNLLAGRSKGCKKCAARQKARTHGMKNSREYHSWQSMKQRCLNTSVRSYADYGGRGIIICDRWLNSFENFYADMGKRPEGHTLDRINNEGNYEPSNCRWATPSEQSLNQRKRTISNAA